MANYPKYTLTGKTPVATYENLVQYNVESASLVSGDGNDISNIYVTGSLLGTSSYSITSSHTHNSISSSYSPVQLPDITDNTSLQNIGIGTNSPNYTLDVTGDINFTGNLYKNGSTYVPNNAVSASYVVTAQTASYVTASTVIATTLLQMPYSSSNHSLTPTTNTGSMYFKISGSVKLLYIYSGTTWCSCSMV